VPGNTVHLLGSEVHSCLFSSSLSCNDDHDTFQVSKNPEGITADDLPADTTFPLVWTATLPNGTGQTGMSLTSRPGRRSATRSPHPWWTVSLGAVPRSRRRR